MLKYSFRVFNDKDELIISAIVPGDEIFNWLERYQSFGVVKAYILSESEVNN